MSLFSPSFSPSSTTRSRIVVRTVTGLAAAGTLLAVSACSNGATDSGGAPSSASSAPSSQSAPPAGATHRVNGVAGRITEENGSTWTVVNAHGKQFTVNITPQTMFGTKAAPATQDQFTVGAQVRAIGTRANGTVTATRVTMAKTPAGASATPPPSAG